MTQETKPYPSLQQMTDEIRAASAAWFAGHGLRTYATYAYVLEAHAEKYGL